METLEEIIDTVLKNYAIDGIVTYKDENRAIINDDELTFRVNFSETALKHCISVDNRECYNKESQCPVHFTLDLSRRKKNRLEQALKFLRTKEGLKASSCFKWPGWDEFRSHVRDEFYRY